MIIHPYTSQPVSAQKKSSFQVQGKIVDVSIVNVETEVLQGSMDCPVLVDFWAPWCGPCQQFIPILEGLQKKYPKPWVLAKVNVDEQGQLAAQFRVQSIPSVVVVAKGRPMEAFMGAVPESQVIKVLDKAYQLYQNDYEENNEDPLAAAEKAFNEGDYARCAHVLNQYLAEEGSLEQRDGERFVLSYAFLGQKQQAEGFVKMLAQPEAVLKWLQYDDVWGVPLDQLIEDWLQKLITHPPLKERLVDLFSLLGSEHRMVQEGRKRMSRILFS